MSKIELLAKFDTIELADAITGEMNYSLDRVDNNGPYCKENCRWAASAEQASNRRPRRIKEAA